jgi:hypothetical protein
MHLENRIKKGNFSLSLPPFLGRLSAAARPAPLPSPPWAPRGPARHAAHPLLISSPRVAHPRLGPDWRRGGPTAPSPSTRPARAARVGATAAAATPWWGSLVSPTSSPTPPFSLSLLYPAHASLSLPRRRLSSPRGKLPPSSLPSPLPSLPRPWRRPAGPGSLSLAPVSAAAPSASALVAMARGPALSPRRGFPRPASYPRPGAPARRPALAPARL